MDFALTRARGGGSGAGFFGGGVSPHVLCPAFHGFRSFDGDHIFVVWGPQLYENNIPGASKVAQGLVGTRCFSLEFVVVRVKLEISRASFGMTWRGVQAPECPLKDPRRDSLKELGTASDCIAGNHRVTGRHMQIGDWKVGRRALASSTSPQIHIC